MAQFNYSTYASQEAKTYSTDRKVGYFSLKDDGDEAIVRFDYSSPEEFNIVTVHNVQVDGRWRRISCLREGTEPLSKCPLCESGEKVLLKFYVKLVEYTKDENGNVVSQAKVWERPASFSKYLASLINEYGDLKNQIFKIKRRGAKGDMSTTYDVLYANPTIYKEELGYAKDFSAFDNFDLAHHSYMEKTPEELREFLQTGSFPARQQKMNSNTQEVQAKPQINTPQREVIQETTQVEYTKQPQQAADPTFNRPRRTYEYK